MSTVAWDGKSLAADHQGAHGGTKVSVSKLYRFADKGEVAATTGDYAAGMIMVEWYQAGADLTNYPRCQADEDNNATLIVAKKGGVCCFYGMHPHEVRVSDPFMAWGSGKDYALGAMAMGATAGQAVMVACKFDAWSGGLVEAFPTT